jgi:hypothetical protein
MLPFSGERSVRNLDALAGLDDAAGVRQSGGSPEHDRRGEALAELVRLLDHGAGLGGVGGLDQRHLAHLREVAAVLLVLRGVHARVVRDQDDEPGVGTGVGKDHERVRGDVQADMLHRD